MNIGISLFSGRQPLDAAVIAQKAEALGFDSLWLGEHPVIPVHSSSPAPGTSGGSIPDFYSRLVDPLLPLPRPSPVTPGLRPGPGLRRVPSGIRLLLPKAVPPWDNFPKGHLLSG